MKKAAFILLLLAAMMLMACEKRYPDGPCISFIKADNRIAGKWKISELTIDGNDVSNPAFSNFTLSFFFNIEHNAFADLVSNSNDSVVAQSYLIINDRRTIMEFGLLRRPGNEIAADSILLLIPAMEIRNEWVITRLRKKEMTISTLYGDHEYKLQLTLSSDFDNY